MLIVSDHFINQCVPKIVTTAGDNILVMVRDNYLPNSCDTDVSIVRDIISSVRATSTFEQ